MSRCGSMIPGDHRISTKHIHSFPPSFDGWRHEAHMPPFLCYGLSELISEVTRVKYEDNLKNGEKTRFTRENAKEYGSRGGKASAKAKRRKKNLRELTRIVLELSLTDGKMKEQLMALGLEEEDITNQAAMTASMLMKAIGGDVQAAVYLRDTAGENVLQELKREEVTLRKQQFEHQKEMDAKRGGMDAKGIFERLDEVLDSMGGGDGIQ